MNSTNSANPFTSLYLRLVSLTFWSIFAGLVLFPSAISEVVTAVIQRQVSSHGIFVPLLSLAFVWTKRDALKETEPKVSYLGLPLIAVTLALGLLGIGTFHIGFLAYVVFLTGLVLLHLGHGFCGIVCFPLLFLITMIPLPHSAYLAMANWCRDIAFGGSSWIISALGVPAFREDLSFHLPNAILRIDIGCSGIRYLVSYLVFGLAYAYLYRTSFWSRLGVVASTIPISLFASIIRLTAIFLLSYIFGPKMAEYWPHVITSWIIFSLVLMTSILLDRFLHEKYLKRKQASRSPRPAAF